VKLLPALRILSCASLCLRCSTSSPFTWHLKKRHIHCKKGYGFSLPQPRNVSNQILLGRESLNFYRPGRVWLVTSRLVTEKSFNFFTVRYSCFINYSKTYSFLIICLGKVRSGLASVILRKKPVNHIRQYKDLIHRIFYSPSVRIFHVCEFCVVCTN
jgi:hypothetical protein